MDLVSRPDPDDARLKIDLAKLEARLTEARTDLAAYRDRVGAFEARYFAAFGRLYAELTELEARIAEAEADYRPDDASKRRKAERMRARLSHVPAASAGKAPADEDLRGLYRELAKRIHPDLARDEGERERRGELMAKANDAYARGDGAALSLLASNEDASEGRAVPQDRLALVAAELARVEAELADERDGELARLMRRDDRMREEGRDLFRKLTGELEAYRKEAQKRLNTLTRRLSRRG